MPDTKPDSDSKVSDELKRLVGKRNQLKSQLDSFSDFLTKISGTAPDQLSDSEVQVRACKAETFMEQFEATQLEIELLDSSESNSRELRDFESIFYPLLAKAKQIIKDKQVGATQGLSNQSVINQSSTNNYGVLGNPLWSGGAKLPSLGLPKFSGDFEKWTHFYETFQTLVDKNFNLDDIQKFYYLLDCLEGEARRVLDCLEVTRDNYPVALDLLEKRFKNKPLIIGKHLKSLVDMPVVSKECSFSLRNLSDNLEKHIRALRALGEPVDTWDRILIFIVGRKLDVITKKEWEEKSIAEFQGDPQLVDFTNFISNKCLILESVEANVKGVRSFVDKDRVAGTVKGTRGVHAVFENKKIRCEVCQGSHFVYYCDKLLSLSIADRATEIRRLKLCFNCLRSSHTASACRSEGCEKCRGRHNTLLHRQKGQEHSQVETQESAGLGNSVVESTAHHACLGSSDSEENQLVATTSCSIAPRKPHQVLLSTAVVYIKDRDDNFVKCRALLDSGSQINLISRDLVNRLKLTVNKTNIPISGVNEMLTSINCRTRSQIRSCHNNFNVSLSFLILENITSNIPVKYFDRSNINIPTNIKLADPEFNNPSKVDILIGAGIFFNLLCVGQIRTGLDSPLLQKTVLGWVISGPVGSWENNNDSKNQHSQISCHAVVKGNEVDLERFWKIEEVEYKQYYSKEELDCEQKFVETVSRDNSGRFYVELPVKENVNKLGESLENAKVRFNSLERKFSKNAGFKERYVAFMEEYIRLGHMTRLTDDEIETENNVCYLPHHGVINEGSLTTKLRVVFDASAKTVGGLSLNDVLQVGPCIQDDLFDILLRFRQDAVVLTADIAKMYRQVRISEQHRDLQRILWRSNSNKNLDHYRLNTVTYGTGPASFLATRCLKQIALDISDQFPEVSKVIQRNVYVDDLIVSVNSLEKAIELGKLVSEELNKYGFPLHKWSSNKKEVLEALIPNENETLGYLITDSDNKKTLGIFWQAKLDNLEYIVQINSTKQKIVTKRLILSITSQIFDPLGLVGPVTIKAKILLQKLWQLKLKWDETIPLELDTYWKVFYHQLESLNQIKIPRQISISNGVSFQIHGFCDASETSYGTCLYLRSMDVRGDILGRLICAKSRVAPIKSLSLPRLELCGALLLSRLVQKVVGALELNIEGVFLWTDSTIVLSWLSEEPSKWQCFVANRVSEIQGLTKEYQWGHVISKENPADIISRGVQPNELEGLELWWLGPSWLLSSPEMWPKCTSNAVSVPERRNTKMSFISVVSDYSIFEKYSSFFKLLKIVALIFRFYDNLKCKREFRKVGKLQTEELNRSLNALIRIMQGQVFNTEINSLKNSQNLSKQSPLISLDPFIDSNNILRVGGRIRNSCEKYDTKFPIILPQKHHLTKLIILDYHHKQLHAGAQSILTSLRQNYWILNGRRVVRSTLRKCITCFRVKPFSLSQKMGDLPEDRVTPQRPFLICGVDFAGPFKLKDGKLRNRSIVKGYMCIFVCFSTKAAHIELVGDLSTLSFLNCLKRFISRRGLCTRIYSDNATNFIGAHNELQKLAEFLSSLESDSDFNNYCLSNQIDWKFIAPRSPHQGGLWESAVKSAKHHLLRLLGNLTLTFEDMSTILTQVEAALNSRPLTQLSCDPHDLLPLTPGHFLIGDSLKAIPQKNVIELPTNRLNHYYSIQKIYQLFWSRWSSEYLSTLQQRTKWRESTENIKIGSMVVLKEDNIAPLNWKLGRIISVHPGADQKVRVVTVRTILGLVKRSVQKLCVLPID